MNIIDRIVASVSPERAVERARARKILAAYEAAKPTRTRRNPQDNRSGDGTTEGATATLRGQARHLDQNHDLATGVLNVLVNNTVGAKGIGVEFLPKNKDGLVNKELADELTWYYAEWCRKPETTGEYSMAKTQRLLARSWFRDGEVLAKSLMGTVPFLDHQTMVPYSLELLEADYIADVNDPENGVVQGVERSSWGRPRYFHLYEQHPGDHNGYTAKVRRVNADLIDHVKMVNRIRQARGVSVFAAVMNRLNDLKDYEEAERVAARISAVMAAYIKKGSPDQYTPPSDDDDGRLFDFSPGMMFDNLMPGEEVGTIQSNRPSALLLPFRDAMLKAVASGTNSGYSSIAKNYDGTYSAQRQELVEQWAHYGALSNEFISMFLEPVVRRFITMAITSGKVRVPASVDRDTLFDAEFQTPAMPWIDPAKEATGHEKHLGLKLTSPQKIIRSRGDRPEDILDQWQAWDQALKERGITTPESPQNAGFSDSGDDENGK